MEDTPKSPSGGAAGGHGMLKGRGRGRHNPDSTWADRLISPAIASPVPVKAGPAVASPAKGRGRGRGRGNGRGGATRGTAKKVAANGRAANTDSGTEKSTAEAVADGSFLKAQAAEERIKELKSNFIAVTNAIRPVLEELAERNVDLLSDKFDAHEDVAAFKQIRTFLDKRLSDTLTTVDNRHRLESNLRSEVFALKTSLTNSDFQRQYDEATEDFYDAQLRRLDILEEMREHRLPVDLVDKSYQFKPVSEDRIKWQKTHIETENGVEVPCAKTIKAPEILQIEQERRDQLAALITTRSSPAKRKAEADLFGHVVSKHLANITNGDKPSFTPRHIGGLLTNDVDGDDTPSRLPSPIASKLPSPSPETASKEESPDGDRPYIPSASSDPDENGVRLISKRRPATVDNYSRLMLPCLYEYEDHEIGFRDSFNDRTRYKSTRVPKFYNKPNSFAFFVDRMISSVDIGAYEPGDLSEEIIEKHGLHPKYGLFLKTSRNDAEPPAPVVSGDHPIVMIAPNGQTLHSSRSIPQKQLDEHNTEREMKSNLSHILAIYRNKEAAETREITPEPSDRAERRLELLDGREYSPPLLPPSEPEDTRQRSETIQRGITPDEDVPEGSSMDSLLGWNALFEAVKVAAEDEARAAAVAQPRRTPFDPVRDVFDSPAPPPQQPALDTLRLSIMADVAAEAPRQIEPLTIIPNPTPTLIEQPAIIPMPQPTHIEQPAAIPLPTPDHVEQPALNEPPVAASYEEPSQAVERTAPEQSYPPMTGTFHEEQAQQPMVPEYHYSSSPAPGPMPSQPPTTQNAQSQLPEPPFERQPEPMAHQQPVYPTQEHSSHPATHQSDESQQRVEPMMLDPRLFGESDSQPRDVAGPPKDLNNQLSSRNFLHTALNPTPQRPSPIQNHHGVAYSYEDASTGHTGPASAAAYPRRDTTTSPAPASFGSTAPGPPFDHRDYASQMVEANQAEPMAPAPYHSMVGSSSTGYHNVAPARPYPGSAYNPMREPPQPSMSGPPAYLNNFINHGVPEQQQPPPPMPSHGGTPFMSHGMHSTPPSFAQQQQHHAQQYPPRQPPYQMAPGYPTPANGQYTGPGMPSLSQQHQPQPHQYQSAPHQHQMVMQMEPPPVGNIPTRGRPNRSNNERAKGGPPNTARYRRLASAAPMPRWPRELKTVPFDYREGIKDYSAVEPPPCHGPKQVRGWHNTVRKPNGGQESTRHMN